MWPRCVIIQITPKVSSIPLYKEKQREREWVRSTWDAVVSSLLHQHILKTGHQYLPAGHTLKTQPTNHRHTQTESAAVPDKLLIHTHTHSLYCNTSWLFSSPASPLIGFLSVVIFFLSSISLRPLRNIIRNDN